MQKRGLLRTALAVPLIAATMPLALSGPAAAQGEPSGEPLRFNVLSTAPASLAAAEDAVRAAGGQVLRRNDAVGLLTATAPRDGFAERVGSDPAVAEVAQERAIGHAPRSEAGGAPEQDRVEREHHYAPGAGTPAPKAAPQAAPQAEPDAGPAGMDPLDDQLWGLKMTRADMARHKQAGDERVLVGVLDTGVDSSHPDIAPNFNAELSRNFTRDIPYDRNGTEVDGPCEFRGCVDPADHDDNGHGTHVAGTIAGALNGMGVSGVAPEASIVNIRGGQDSGYFFLQSVVDALTYAGDVGIDVVNMSFYVDPWLYNCTANPADTAEQQAQQRITLKTMRRTLNYAHGKDVTLIASLGNGHSDKGNPQTDDSSPNFPDGTAHDREINNDSCFTMPTEGPHVLSVSSLGPSQAKSGFSDYGVEQISVSAPGGWYRDYFGSPWFQTNENLILSAYPRNVALAEGAIDADGNITEEGKADGVQRNCTPDGCGYYQWLQGTSMASPHAVGVAALIVSEYGQYSDDSVRMDPDKVQAVLEGTAAEVPCPTPRTVSYEDEGRPASWNATCEGDVEFNGFYGHGIVDAFSAVTHGQRYLHGRS